MGIIERKTVQDTKLKQSFERNINEIHSQNYNFSRKDEEVKFLKTVTKDEIVAIFQSGVKNNNRVLLSAAEGNLPDSPEGEKSHFVEKNLPPGGAFNEFAVITDIAEFRNAHSFIAKA